MGARPAGVRIASLPRRIVAALIDVLVLFPPLVVGVGVASWLYETRPRGRRHDRVLSQRDKAAPHEGLMLIERWGSSFKVFSVASQIWSRNSRSPGARAMRLRRVDARTGGPVTVRSVLLRYAFGELWSALTASVYRPVDRRATERRRALLHQLEEIERQYPDDLDARRRAIQECYRANGVKPFGSCAWRLPLISVPSIPALWSPHNQTMADRLAGTIVVVLDPRSRTPDNDRVQISVARTKG